MNQDGNRMKHGKALILGLAAAVMTACASGGGAGPAEAGGGGGNQPRDTDAIKSASVHIVQAGLAEGDRAQQEFQQAMTDAMTAIQETPENPKAYLVAGQAAVGLQEWARADSMFDRAAELYPGYGEQLVVEREQGWVSAYNLGAEAMNAGDYEEAVDYFQGADMLYQDRPEARIALGSLHVNMGNMDAAVDAYLGALEILSADPPEGMAEEQIASWQESRQMAAFNAAELLAQSGDFERAAEVLQGFLADHEATLAPEAALRAKTSLAGYLARSGNAAEAEALYDEIMARTDLTADQYFQIGIGFFNTGDYEQAAEAFATAAEMNPYSRDAYLNLVQSLYSQAVELEEGEETPGRDDQLLAIYNRILETAQSVREFDPLNRNLLSFMLRAYRAKTDLVSSQEAEALNREAQDLVRTYQSQAYEIRDIQINLVGGNAQLAGTLVNLSGTPGETVQLQFEILGAQGQVIDTAEVTVTVPEAEASAQFSAPLDVPGGEFAGWRYELIG